MSGVDTDTDTHLTTQFLISYIELITYLTTEDKLEDPHDEHAGDAHQEGQDGGQEEAPPLSLPQTFLAVKLTKSRVSSFVMD